MQMALLQTAVLALFLFAFMPNNEAAAPFFLQAISSALGTIPFTGGPMTTGLIGAKLAVGSKLLYYLGYFGRQRSKPKPTLKESPPSKLNIGGPAGGIQNMFLPNTFGGGFSQQFVGFNRPNSMSPFIQAYDPYQMLLAQGIEPAMAMQAMNFNGGGQAIPASRFPFPAGTPGRPMTDGPGEFPNEVQEFRPDRNSEDVESFFTFLRDMDDNTCISRLMCDIGANPSFLGEFSENIHGVIGSLDVLPSSGAFQYIAIMEIGGREGGCGKRFPQCSDAAYEVVKNVAPSVGVPHNINSDTFNKL